MQDPLPHVALHLFSRVGREQPISGTWPSLLPVFGVRIRAAVDCSYRARPLAVGCLFLFVWGQQPDRLGRSVLLFTSSAAPFAGMATSCGIGGHARRSVGRRRGVLGAYLVFFPDVPIDMYGMAGSSPSRLPLRVLGGLRLPLVGGRSRPARSAPYSLAGLRVRDGRAEAFLSIQE
jgi:hypothetical protein